MRKNFNILFVLLTLLLSSCSEKREISDEKVRVNYISGQIFCEGIHKVSQKGNSKRKNRKGIWKFYYTNGKPETILEYDNNGNLLNRKSYNENENLITSEVNSETSMNYSEFYENGNIKYENITKVEFEQGEEDSYETYYETIKEYYTNGQLKSQKETVDDELEGKASIWDINGNLILEYEYEEGLIQVQ